MFAGIAPNPKVVGVRIFKAENLRLPPKPDGKTRKPAQKWKVTVVGGKKKMATESVYSPYGNPLWDCELNVKIPREAEPVCLLVTDSDDHHVGQVVIPVFKIPSRPGNPQERPTDPSRLLVAELEPTKKAPNPSGRLHYWIWVNEYRTAENDKKHSRSSSHSVLSLSTLKNKRRSSGADSLAYSGSVLSVNSNTLDTKDGRKRGAVFHRRSTRDLLKSAADFSQRPRLGLKSSHESSPQRVANNIYDPTYRGPMDRPVDNDGSILGASSEIMMDNSVNRSPALGSVGGSQVSMPVSPEQRKLTIVSERATVDTSSLELTKSPESEPQRRPQLLRLKPTSCSTAGGVEVTVYAIGLTDEIMRYASVLVDGFNVPRQDWFVETPPDLTTDPIQQLRIHMPERPTGRCWIEVETLNHGRLRCPQEFVYTNEATRAPVGMSDSSKDTQASNEVPPKTSPFVRAGSTRSSSLLIRDRRSSRRGRVSVQQQQNPDANTSPNASAVTPASTGLKSETAESPSINDPRPDLSASPYNPMDEADESPSMNGAAQQSSNTTVRSDNNTAKQSARVYDGSSSEEEEATSSEEDDGEGEEAGVNNSKNGFPVYDRVGSHRSAASGQSKNAYQEDAKLENESLRAMLSEANRFIEAMKLQTVELEQQLSERNADVDRLSSELCALRNQLLKDGLEKYLEKRSLKLRF